LQFSKLRLKGLCEKAVHDATHNYLSKFFLVFTFDDHKWTDEQMKALEKGMSDYMNFVRDLFTGAVAFRYSAPTGQKSTFRKQRKSKKKEGSEYDGELFYSSSTYYHAGFVDENVELNDGRVSTRYGVNHGGDLG
jgi:hypothetical protein